MTKDDFQKCAGNSGKSATAGDAGRGIQVVSLAPQLQGPRPPAPRPPMPQVPYGARIMPVATSIKVLPASVHAVEVSKHIKTESVTDGE